MAVTSSVAGRSVSAPARAAWLDVFRGLTMAAMVVVNNPGDWNNVYWPLLHSKWDGWTPTDLVFPFFLFIVGVSITLSRRSASWGSILRRGTLIVVIGWLLALYPSFDFAHLRIPGVLPRIGVCYLFAAAFYKLTASRRDQGRWMVIAAVTLCVVYWLIMTQVPNPAGVRGDLTPEGNWGAYIDRALFSGHLWANSKTWDPEGLLGTIPAIATPLLGIAAGLWLRTERSAGEKAAALAAAGVLAVAIGYAWNPFFPINKALWSSSFVFLTAGFAAILLALLVRFPLPAPIARPFVILGVNAIALYAAAALLEETMIHFTVTGAGGQAVTLGEWVFAHGFAPFAPPKIASLGYAVANLVVLFALLAWMYRRRIFLRV